MNAMQDPQEVGRPQAVHRRLYKGAYDVAHRHGTHLGQEAQALCRAVCKGPGQILRGERCRLTSCLANWQSMDSTWHALTGAPTAPLGRE